MAIIKCRIEKGVLSTECSGFKGVACDNRVAPLMKILDAHTVAHQHTEEYQEHETESFLESHNDSGE